jgi:hypothetical protein
VNDAFIARIMTGLPAALMGVSFGLRTQENAGNTLTIRKIVDAMEIV